MKNLIFAILVASSLVSCSPSTQIEKSWMEPGATVSGGTENKALVVALVKDESSRRVIEDELVKRLNASAVASYKIITPELMKADSEDALNQQIKSGGFTHILVMRLADVEKETSYVPGSTNMGYYGGYGRYYGYGAGFYSSPGYYQTDKNYFIETTIYSINPDKLLWTGTTKTVNPSKINKAVNEIADVITAQMKKDGFLK
jgi:hypothetical protein